MIVETYTGQRLDLTRIFRKTVKPVGVRASGARVANIRHPHTSSFNADQSIDVSALNQFMNMKSFLIYLRMHARSLLYN